MKRRYWDSVRPEEYAKRDGVPVLRTPGQVKLYVQRWSHEVKPALHRLHWTERDDETVYLRLGREVVDIVDGSVVDVLTQVEAEAKWHQWRKEEGGKVAFVVMVAVWLLVALIALCMELF